jgi:aminopeptidase N
MKPDTPPTILLSDYKPAPYEIADLHLDFSLEPRATRVKSRLALKPRGGREPLVFSGEKLKLISVKLNGGDVAHTVDEHNLTIAELPAAEFTLEIETECDPAGNTVLSGLYQSNGMYCTQCEAEGFRRITYFYDRPDVMTRYTVRMEASKALCPVLLCNGNYQRCCGNRPALRRLAGPAPEAELPVCAGGG